VTEPEEEALLPRMICALERIADSLERIVQIVQLHGVPATETVQEAAGSKPAEKEKEEEETAESGEG